MKDTEWDVLSTRQLLNKWSHDCPTTHQSRFSKRCKLLNHSQLVSIFNTKQSLVFVQIKKKSVQLTMETGLELEMNQGESLPLSLLTMLFKWSLDV